ncbi:hypothetical protein ABPG74_017230 [Tetrahymena malaccensis]
MVGSCLINKNQGQIQNNGNNRPQNRNHNQPSKLTAQEVNSVMFDLWKNDRFRACKDIISPDECTKLIKEYNHKMDIAYKLLSDEERIFAQQQAKEFERVWFLIKTEFISQYTVDYVVRKIKEKRDLLNRVNNLASQIKV